MNNRFLSFLWSLVLGLVLTLGNLPAACAQESDTDEFTLEEITVTAEKRAENVQKVPIAMEVITGDMMIEMGKNNIDEILRDISNVIINQSSDGMRVTLRGLANVEGTQRGLTVSTPTVAINVDGAYNASNLAGQNLFDIERVEVLMGPQSTMYSSNSPGGIINIVTASPKTDKFSVSGSVEYGNYNLLNTQASVNVPVIQDKVALRAAVNLTKRNSYIEGADSTSAEDTKSARIKALYQPSDRLSFTLTGSWTKRGGGGGMGGGVKAFDYQDGYWYTVDLNEGGTREGKVTDPWTASDADTSNATWDNTTKSLSAEMVLNIGFASLTVVPSYTKDKSSSFEPVTSGEGPDAEEVDANRIQERIQKSLEARMASSTDFELFSWILGGTVYKGEETRGSDYVDPDAFDEYNTNNQNSKAVFANITYPITDRLRATGGYRRSWDTVDNTEAAKEALGQTNVTSTNSQEYSKPDYKVGFEYDLGENSMVYADRNSSYRVSGMAMGEQPPERLTAYTVGSKNRFLDNKLQFNAAVYYYKYKNKKASVGRYYGDYTETEIGWDMEDNAFPLDGVVQVNIDPDTGEDHLFTISDGGSQSYGNFRSYGVDLSTSAILTSQDKLNLSVSYLNTKWTDLYFHFDYYNIWPDEDYSGLEGIYSPNWSANATYDHNFNLWNGGTLTGTLSAQYQSEFLLAWKPSWKPFTYQEPHTIWDISFSYAHPDGRWTLNAYMKNLFNYAVKTSFMDMGGSSVMMIGSPRTYGGIFSFRF